MNSPSEKPSLSSSESVGSEVRTLGRPRFEPGRCEAPGSNRSGSEKATPDSKAKHQREQFIASITRRVERSSQWLHFNAEGFTADELERAHSLFGGLIDLVSDVRGVVVVRSGVDHTGAPASVSLSSVTLAERSEAKRGALQEVFFSADAFEALERENADLVERIDALRIDRDKWRESSDVYAQNLTAEVRQRREWQKLRDVLRDKARETQHENDALACEVARLSSVIAVVQRQRADQQNKAESTERTLRAVERERDDALKRLDVAVGVRP